MKILEFVQKEIENIVKSEVKTAFNNDAKLLEKAKNIIYSEYDFMDEVVNKFKNDKDLSKLKFTNFVLFNLATDDVFSNQAKILINEFKKSNPDNKIYGLLWISMKKNEFENEEFLYSELEAFYKTLFEDFDYLINLEDLFEEVSSLLNLIIDSEFWNSDNVCSIIDDAVKKYPKNIYLRERLTNIYVARNEFDKVIETINLFEENLPDNQKTFNYEEDEFRRQTIHLGLLQIKIIIYYKLQRDKEALNEANRLILNIPYLFLFSGEEPEKDIYQYIETFLIRISIYIKDNKVKNHNLIIADCKTLGYDWVDMAENDWLKFYPEAIQYLKSLKKENCL